MLSKFVLGKKLPNLETSAGAGFSLSVLADETTSLFLTTILPKTSSEELLFCNCFSTYLLRPNKAAPARIPPAPAVTSAELIVIGLKSFEFFVADQ